MTFSVCRNGSHTNSTFFNILHIFQNHKHLKIYNHFGIIKRTFDSVNNFCVGNYSFDELTSSLSKNIFYQVRLVGWLVG